MTKESHPFLIVLLAAVIATTPLAVDMYLPAMPDIAQDLDTHIGSVQQSLSIFLAAYGAGMLLFGPLAERYGKRAGGYTRVMKSGFRHGDNAATAVIELVDRDVTAKGKDSGSQQHSGCLKHKLWSI